MRIRKNAKLSPLLFSSSSFSQQGVETFQTHVCQLNQSPWDVIPFDSIQFDAADDNSFTHGNAAAATDSFGPVESSSRTNNSVASMMDTEENNKTGIIADVAMMALEDNNNNNNNNNSYQRGYKKVFGKKSSCCNAIDAKGWPCKNGVVKHDQSFCNHHLSLLKSNNDKTSTSSTSTPALSSGVGILSRAGVKPQPRTMKKSLSSETTEFYYYSGFGPRWGKRRGHKNGEASCNDNTSSGENNSTMLESGNVVDDVVGISLQRDGFVDDEEDCDDDDDNRKKRMRKPVKERSLKSLM